MATLDIRKGFPEPIFDIRWCENTNFSICKTAGGICVGNRVVHITSKQAADGLIRALQKAKELWLE